MRSFTIVLDRDLLGRISDPTDLHCKVRADTTVAQLLQVLIEAQPHLGGIIYDEDGRPSSIIPIFLGTPAKKTDISSLNGIDTIIREEDTHLYIR